MSKTQDQKNQPTQDWHWEDVMAALRKSGWSLRQLTIEMGYPEGSSALGSVKRHPWPRGELILATALKKKPHEIWPSRYHADGTPNRRRGRDIRRPTAGADMTPLVALRRNPQARKAG